MEIRDLAKKVNTFRLLQLEIARTHTKSTVDRVLNIPNILLLVIAGVGTLSTLEIGSKSHNLMAAFVTLAVQTVTLAFFFIAPKHENIITRVLLASYLVFDAIVLLDQNDSSPLTLYWTILYLLLTFVIAGGAESFLWIGLHFSVVVASVIRQALYIEPRLDISSIRIFFYTYVLVCGLGFILEYASKLTADRASIQKKQLEETNARYDVILNSVGEGLIATDTNGIVEFINKEATTLLKMDRNDLIGQPYTAVVMAKNDNGEVIQHKDRLLTSVLTTGEPESITIASKQKQHFVCGDGSELLVGMVISPVKVIGQVRGAIILFHDISLEDEVDKAKSEFVSLASHQLRTPLNVISWYVEKLISERKGHLNEKQKEYLSEVGTNNQRMIRLVSDLLNVSRVELGRVKVKSQRVELFTLIDSLTKEIAPIIEQKHLDFTTQIDDGVKGIFETSDESMVTIIIQNLISNAVKYTPQDGKVSLLVTENSSQVSLPDALLDKFASHPKGVFLSVIDSGVGIPLNQRDKIFSKLFRADNAQDLDVNGTGLGLYITQSFAQALGGYIWFDSIENEGTTFTCFLPYEGAHP